MPDVTDNTSAPVSTNDTDGSTNVSSLDAADQHVVWSGRQKMAWVALWGIILPTCYVIAQVSDVSRLEKIGEMLSWYYLSLASIVGAFVGFKAWASIRGK